MTHRHGLAALVLAIVATLAVGTGPADASDTAITLTLTDSGTLSISAPATLTASAAVSTTVTDVVIPVTDITITDGRTFPGAFTASAVSTDLSSGSDSIPATTMVWATTSAVDSSGTPAAILGAGGALSPFAVMAVGLGPGLGDTQYDIEGTITILIANKLPGDYTGTITMSIT